MTGVSKMKISISVKNSENTVTIGSGFLLSVIITLSCAFAYLRYATYLYEVSSTILIADEENGGGGSSELSAFADLGLLAGSKTSLDTEMGILKSRTLMERVIKELGFQVSYFTKSRIGTTEIYMNDVPFNINLFVDDSIFLRLNKSFSINAISNTQFVFDDGTANEMRKYVFGESIKYDFGETGCYP